MKTEIDDHAMRLMAEMLKTLMPEGWAFTLLTFEVNKSPGIVNYISSAERDSMKATMQELIDKWNKLQEFNDVNPN